MIYESRIQEAFVEELRKIAAGGVFGAVKSIAGKAAKSPTARTLGEGAVQSLAWNAPTMVQGAMQQRRQRKQQTGGQRPSGWVGQ